eukprot:c39499_g1_i1.p1 GENE.c39499_g1_i1~~c39499_g1_i1.p1  ORF type:complete len:694 (+),score=202.40 c39499_g1_i1:39-2084(+)
MSQAQDTEKEILALQAAITKQAEIVRELKEANAAKDKLKHPVEELKRLKTALETLTQSNVSKFNLDRAACEDLLKRRFFFTPSFSIYGGVKGLFDFGPPGCALKANFLAFWRQFFVLEENMLEIDCPCLTPKAVLETSGHVDKFTDFMVKEIRSDGKPPEYFRADHLLEEKIDELIEDPNLSPETKKAYLAVQAQVDNYSGEELGQKLTEFGVLSPNGFPISPPEAFNLMFATQIGPTGLYPGYMRPETAQGIFVNFRKLLEFNGGKMPFAGAQIGQAFRNEISPRAGLLRVREFTLAEIEHFVNPNKKDHPKFERVRDVVMNLFPRERQLMVQGTAAVKIGDAVAQGMVNNETLGYFMARTHLFLTQCGIPVQHLRFRQHLEHEMAHYASDCWDAEIETTYGWVEVTGHADRACFDLTQHAAKTNTAMEAREEFDEPQLVTSYEYEMNKGLMGKQLKNLNKGVTEYLETLNEKQRIELGASLDKNGKADIKLCTGESVTLTTEMLKVVKREKRVQSQSYTPSVIEPSYGVGRILYSILEHSYYVRPGDDEQRAVLRFPPVLAPVKCSVLPLMIKPELMPATHQVAEALTRHGVSSKVDASGTAIGRRYARTDEIGVPFGITVDMKTVEEGHPAFGTVTLRERDSMAQVRLRLDEVGPIVSQLCDGRLTWDHVYATFPKEE